MGDWKTIITIGREYGAGGRTVAKLLSDRLGIPHYDKEIITLAAEKSGLPEQTIRWPEQGSGKTLLSWFLPRGPMSAYDQAILAQANIIRKLAEEGPCIIVGRGADYILRDREDVLNVFLYADQADKLAYAMDTYGDRPEEAEQRVRQVDASRESYYHYLTRAKWGDLKRYHLSLNTSPIGKEGGADLIVQYAKLRRAKLGL